MDSENSFQNTSSELETSSQHSLVVQGETIKLSQRRWLILAGVTIVALLYSFANQTSPVLDVMIKVVGIDKDKYFYLERLFGYQMALISIPTARFVDRFGIRLSMYLMAVLTAIHAILKGLLYSIHFPNWQHYRLSYYIASNFVNIQILAIYMCLPLKISEVWFADSEKSFAWSMMSSLNGISIALASYLYPKLIPRIEDVKLLFHISTACAVITVITIFVTITKSKPKHPANTRMAKDPARDKQSLWVSIKKMSKQRDLSLDLIHSAVFNSIYSAMVGNIPDILESAKRSEVFTGDLNSIFNLLHMTLTMTFANFVHLVRNPTRTCKTASFFQAILYVTYLFVMLTPNPAWLLYMSALTFAMVKSWAVPNFTNMQAHLACGTVSYATIVGVGITVACIANTLIGIPFVALIKIDKKGTDYTWAIAFISIVCMVNEAVFLTLFQGKSAKQMEEEATEPPSTYAEIPTSIRTIHC